MRVYKVFTHDLRSPVVGGEPVWNGRLPYQLPVVSIARSEATCGSGWAACCSPVAALQCAGLFPNGRPARVFSGYVSGEYAEANDWAMPGFKKLRCESILLEEEVPLEAVVEELAGRAFTQFTGTMIQQLFRWIDALKRPLHSEHVVGYAVFEALKQQGFGHMRVFPHTAMSGIERIQFNIKRVTRQHSVSVRIQECNNAGKRDEFPLKNDRLHPASGNAFLEPNTVWTEEQQAGAWSAKAALEYFYSHMTANPEKLTAGLIDAYRWGMAQVIAHDKDTAIFVMEEENGKPENETPNDWFTERVRAEVAAEASTAAGATANSGGWSADGLRPAGHEERNPLNVWKP